MRRDVYEDRQKPPALAYLEALGFEFRGARSYGAVWFWRVKKAGNKSWQVDGEEYLIILAKKKGWAGETV